jgi:hypothetical protein
MLPDLRVGVAAVLTGLTLIIAAFGLAATVRLAQHAKIVPIEGPRALAYAEPDDWEVTAIRRRAFSIDKTSYDLLAALPGASPQPHAMDMSPAAPATVRSIILRRAAIVTNTPVTNVVVDDTVAAPEPLKPPGLTPDLVPDTGSLEPRTSEHAKEETIVTAAVPTKEGSTPAINTPAQTLDRAVATPKVRASAVTTSTESRPPASTIAAAVPSRAARRRPQRKVSAPIWANRRAIAAPIPPPAPVTIANCPCSSGSVNLAME